jgi:hypothetical protein
MTPRQPALRAFAPADSIHRYSHIQADRRMSK